MLQVGAIVRRAWRDRARTLQRIFPEPRVGDSASRQIGVLTESLAITTPVNTVAFVMRRHNLLPHLVDDRLEASAVE